MHLAHATLRGVAPFGELQADFCDEHGKPRAITIVHGGAGVGKTTLLQALACTRPGHATVASGLPPTDEGPPQVRCAWHLGEDEPARPHPLLVSTPGGSSSLLPPSSEDDGALQRREQALFDRRAREQGGFVFLLFPANRWFSRQAVSLHAPSRSMLRYDVRATTSFDQASSADLTRETKQALAYAAISSALSGRREHGPTERRRVDPRLLGAAMRETVDGIVRLTGMRYEGLDPLSFEPRFVSVGGRALDFDALPTRTRHLVAYVAITIKTLWAAYPTADPRTAEGVVAIDDVDLHQDAHVMAELVPTLRSSLLGVQWILTTASPTLAASVAPGQILALRRLGEDEPVSLFVDAHARTH
ncbi:ATP-binding protein [Paraliomyxa miuraensis]|uniref:ATP-binding protein n=1 Tax=Paraliomyxa miuraensis TaxID=376150 RepID=UPI00224D82BF|nr:ATP-binding protein [Paraliomyxa miuraensis]MCX4244175.1 ATP-binding protein [Paraliomyxa miuraensis]